MLHLSNLTLSPESDNIEEMKIRFCLILSLLFTIGLSSCASVPASGEGAAPDVQDTHKEKKQNPKKLLFEDWKYKGFGQELPVWFEAAYKGNTEEVRKKAGISNDYKIEIVTAQGINSDQVNKSIWRYLIVKEELFELYDSCWVLLNDKEAEEKNKGYPYFAAAVLLIENKDNK